MAYDARISPTGSGAGIGIGSEAAAFNRTLQPHLDFLRRLAMRLTRNRHDAEDLLQDVLLKLYKHRDRLESVQVLQPWLARVMYYHRIDLRRRRPPDSVFVSLDHRGAGAAAAPEDVPGEQGWQLPDERPGPEIETQGHELSAFVARALEKLPAAQCQFVLLHHVKGLGLEAVSSLTGVPVGTVKAALKQARKTLRASLRVVAPEADAAPVLPPRISRIADARAPARSTAAA